MLRNAIPVMFLLHATISPALAEQQAYVPADITVPQPPTPVRADGQLRLLFEVRMTNYQAYDMAIDGATIADTLDHPLTVYTGDDLTKQVKLLGARGDTSAPVTVHPGGTAILFVDTTLPKGVPTPASVTPTLDLTVQRPKGEIWKRTITLSPVKVLGPPPVIHPPLRDGRWVAVNGLMNPDHRRAYNSVGGRERLAQRFAIDWVKLAPDGRYMHGDPARNTSYESYGSDVLAVAAGRVVAVHDGQPENAGFNSVDSRLVTLDTITGNYVILDIGGGRFALYAHLQPGHILVKPGQKVAVGERLAQLGNSGNSDAPHLHFQITDSPSPLAAEGLPYELDRFEQVGVVDNLDDIITGRGWRPSSNTRTVRRSEFPLDNAVVTFR